MYLVKVTIRYNNETYQAGKVANFTEEDLKVVAPYVELVKGVTAEKKDEPEVVNEKPKTNNKKKTK